MSKSQLYLIDMSQEKKWTPFSISTPVKVGRKDSCDVPIDEESLSGEHAKISEENGEFVLEDLQSTNGTRINGSKITKEVLRDGDLVGFGYKNFMVKICQTPLPQIYRVNDNRSFALALLPFHIGRATENQLAVSDNSISNKHAIISFEDGKYFIKDNGSTNGIRVNGKRTRYHQIEDKDFIKLGNWEATFLCEDSPQNNFFLKFLEEARVGEQVAVKDGLTIGRVQDNQMVITNNSVSSHHAVITWSAGSYWIEDLGSLNGIRISGVRIKKSHLKHGDEVIIGKYPLLFQNANLPLEKFFLVFLGGERGGEELELTNTQISIGRTKRCTIQLNTKDVSSVHAELSATEGTFTLKDKNSTNGTFVNGDKVTSVNLQHGDEIQVGSQSFIFRSSAKLRPMSLSEESFSLVPMVNKKYGKAIPIREKDLFTIGRNMDNDLFLRSKLVSNHHATINKSAGFYVIKDLSSTAGTFVNGEKITEKRLEHGDEITFARSSYVFKSSLRPLGQVLGIAFDWSVAAAAGIVFLFFCLYVVYDNYAGKDSGAETEVEVTKKQEKRLSDDEILANYEKKANKYSKEHYYQKAIETLEEGEKKLNLFAYKKKLEKKIKQLQRLDKLFENIISELKNNEKLNIEIEMPGKGPCTIKSVNPEAHSLLLEPLDKVFFIEYWHKLPKEAFFVVVEKLKYQNKEPYILAQMALERGLYGRCENYLTIALEKFPKQKQQTEELYAKAFKKKIPPGGYVVYQGKIISSKKKERIDEEKERKLKLQQKQLLERQKQENRLKAERIAKEREKREFPLRFTIINEFVYTYSYRKAKKEFNNLLSQLTQPELKAKVRRRLAEIEPAAKLFETLINDINNKNLKNSKFKIGKKITGELVEADEEQVKILVPNGFVRQKWYSLPPDKIHQFFQRMKFDPEDLFQIGAFCFEKELIKEGNDSFIDFLSRFPKQRHLVDNYLAKKFNVPIPKGGFVAYNGRLITPKELTFRKKGYVRYGKDWVTPEDKEKLLAGYVKHKGNWVTKSDKELLAKGYRKYKGKWHSKKEIDRIRQNWEDAWTLKTKHYTLASNISEEFLKDMGDLLEASYKEFEKFFGKKAKRPMTMYAFRTFEDYRKYCLDNGRSNLVRAGGFALRFEQIAVGWKRNSIKELLETMLHEAAHLYHFNSLPRSSAPSWFAEAVATQFEGFKWGNKKLRLDFKALNRLFWIKRSILQGQQFKTEDLLQGQALNLINQNIDMAATFYAQCWAIYYFFTHTSNKKYRDNFAEFVDKVNNGQVRGREAASFMSYFQDDLPDIEKKWTQMILGLK